MVEHLAAGLTEYLRKQNAITTESVPIIRYGFQSGLELTISTAVSILIAVYLHMVLECMVFFCIFISLRFFAGGVHLENYWTCFLLSTCSLAGVLMLVKYMPVESGISIPMIVVCGSIIWYLSPVMSNKKKLEQEKIREWKGKLRVLLVLLSVVCGILFYLKNDRFLWLIALALFVMAAALVAGRLKYSRT